MAYNKARAEKAWLKWKAKEEKHLRELGVNEDTIQRLHTYDWEMFKAERNYQQRHERGHGQKEHDLTRKGRNHDQQFRPRLEQVCDGNRAQSRAR